MSTDQPGSRAADRGDLIVIVVVVVVVAVAGACCLVEMEPHLLQLIVFVRHSLCCNDVTRVTRSAISLHAV